MFLFAVALSTLSLATCVIIQSTNSLMIPLFAFMILSERLSLKEIIGLMICFIGIIIVQSGDEKAYMNDEKVTQTMKNAGVICAILTAIVIASVSVLTRKLKELHFMVVGFWYTLAGCLMFGLA